MTAHPAAIDPLKPWLNVMVTMADVDARKRPRKPQTLERYARECDGWRERDRITMARSKLLHPYPEDILTKEERREADRLLMLKTRLLYPYKGNPLWGQEYM